MAIEIRPHAREATPARVLVAVHGHEPAGWVAEAARAIAEPAAAWPADLVVVGRDVRPRAFRLRLGAAHERVRRRASCTVVVAGRDAAKVAGRGPAVASPRLQAGA